MELSSIIERLNQRIAEANIGVGPVSSDPDFYDYELGCAFVELVNSLPGEDEEELASQDIVLLKDITHHLYSLFSEKPNPNPNSVEQLVRGIAIINDKFSSSAQDEIQGGCFSGDDDLVSLWVKAAHGMGDESYGYILEIYQWLRDERDEEWAEDFREEHDIDEDDW